MDFNELAPILEAAGMAAAKHEAIDFAELADELDEAVAEIEPIWRQLERAGLVYFASLGETDEYPELTRCGRQYLAAKGVFDNDTLFFLSDVVDDLLARRALIHAGTILVDEFRHAVLQGLGAEHAKTLVPAAFAEAVDDRIALNLFAAAVALMARLSCGRPAGCVAEEVMAVGLYVDAKALLDRDKENGRISEEEAQEATAELRQIFELFGDDDVLDMFDMREPADAAVAADSPISKKMGIVDQRLEAWFHPFGSVVETGYLHERS